MEQEFGPPERQVSEDVFRFKQLCKIKIFDNNVETLAPKDVVHLVAVSNKYGLTFVGVDSGFKVIKTSELSKLDIEQGSITTVSAVPVVRKVKLAVMPCHISLSADSLTLSVCFNDNTNTVVNCYDVRAFVNMAKDPLPFCSEILIPGNTAPLLDLKWNPDVAHASMFAACCNKGTLSLWDISNSTAAQLHCLDSDNGISAICWSPKGKQIVCGTLAGKLVQYSKTLEKKREISEPSVFDNNVVIQVVSVLWLSTYSFMTAYSVVGTTDQPSVVIVNAPKTGAVVYTNLEDVCYGSGEDRNQVYYFLNIPEWNLVLTAQGNALEVVVMGKQDVEPEWERWSLEDAARIEMPLANNEDTYPMGLALDLTSQQELVINDSLTLPPAPIFLVLTTEGLLCPYYVINRSKDIQSIVNPPEVLTYAGERLPSGMPKVTQPVVPASQQTTSTTDTTANQSALFHTPRGNLLSRFENETTPKVESMPTTTAPATTGFSFTPKLTSTTSTTSGTAATSAFTFSLSQTTKPTLFGGTPTSEQPQTTKPTLFGGTPTSEQPQTTKPTLFGGTPTSEQPPTIKPSVVTTAATTTSGAASSLFGTTPSFGQPQTTTPIAAPTTNSSNGAPTLFSSTGLFSQSQLAKPSAITTAATSSSGATPSLFTPNIFGQAATGAEQGAAKTVSSASSFTFGSQTQTSSFFTSPGGTAFGVKSDSNALTTTTPTTVAQAFSFAQSGTGALTSGLGFIVPGSTGNSAFSVAPGASASTGIFGSLVKDQSAATSTLTPQQQHQQHQQPAATAATSAAKTATSVGTTLPSKPMTGIFGGATLPTQPAGAPPPSAFGASVAGMKPAVFGTATSASTKPIATTTTATTASKPLLFGTATTASTKPTVLPTTAASVTTGPIATLSTTVTSRPTTFGNQPPEVISTKPNSVLPIATTTAPQAAPVKSTASSALPTPAVPAAVSGIAAIIGDEMLRFQRELDELKRKKIDISCLGTEQEKRELLRGKEDLADFHAEITDCVQSQNDDINELKSLTLNAAAQIEEGKVRSLRHSDPHYRQMLRSRSLDSTSSNKLKEIRGLYHYIENSIHDVNVVLDEQWKINQDKLHGCRRLQTPTTDYIFRAVSNNHNLILDQTRCLKELKEQLQRIKIYNTTSKWNGSATQRESELSSLADSLRDTSISIKSPPRSQTTPVSAKRQAQLRDMLSKRQVTPTRSTHPGHFSIISPHYLRTPSTPSEAASTDEISEDDSEHNQRNIGFSSFAYPVPDNTSTPIRIDEPRGKETKPVIVSQRLPAVVIPADTVKTQPITQPMKPAFSVPKTTVTTRPAAPVSMTGTNFTAFQPPQMSLAASGISAMSTPLVKTVPKPPLPVEPASTVPIAGFTHSGGGTVSWGASPDINKSIKPGISPAGLAALNRSASGPVQINEQSVPKTVPPPVVNIKNIDTKKTSANTTIAVVDSTKVNEGTVKVVTEVLAEIAATSGKKRVSATSAQIIPSSAAAPITSTTTGTAPTIVSSTTTTSSGTSAVSFSFVPPKSTTTTFGSRTQLPNPSVSSSTVISGLKTSGSGFTFTPSIGSTSFSFGTTVSSAKQDDKNAKLQKDTIGTSSVEVENITPPKTPPVTAPQNKTATPGAFFFVGQPDSTAGSGIAEVSTTTPAVTAATGSILSGKPVTAFGKPPTATVTTTSSAVTAAPSTNTAVPETVAATPIVVPTQPSSLTAVQPSSTISAEPPIALPTQPSSLTAVQPSTTTSTATPIVVPTQPSSTTAVQPSSTTTTPTPDASDAAAKKTIFGNVLSTPSTTPEVTSTVTTEVASTSLFGTSTTTKSTNVSIAGLLGKPTPATMTSIVGQSTTTSTGTVPFGQPPTSTGTVPFSQSTTTAPVTNVFGQAVPTTAAKADGGVFGQTTTPTIFGTSTLGKPTTSLATTTTTTTAASTAPTLFGSSFGQTTTSVASTTTTAASTAPSLFGSSFGQTTTSVASTTTTAASTAPSLFGSSFGQTTTSVASTTTAASTAPSLFGSSFGQTTTATSSAFAQQGSTGGFGQSFFGNSTPSASTASSGLFSQSASGTSTFGQSSTSGSLFSQPTTAASSFGQTGFGRPVTTTTAAAATTTSSSGVSFFGSDGGGLFGGLGGKPSADAANKNPFGSAPTTGFSTTPQSLFGSQGAKEFNTGGFSVGSSGFSGGGGVAAAGFVGFSTGQQSPGTTTGASGFGAAPAFGGSSQFGAAPAFGSAFGATPSFGGGATFGAAASPPSVFGEKSSTVTGGFASLASDNSPTFGALAQSQNTSPTFGSIAAVSPNTPTFGSQGAQASGFGSFASPGFSGSGAFGGSPAFGGQQQQQASFTSRRL